MNSVRKKFIDIYKGIGICTIVLVHLTSRGSWLSQGLLAFCVAQFFIISGYLFKIKTNFKDFLCNIIQRILIPLILYGCIDALFTIIWKYFIIKESFNIINLLKIIVKISFVSGSANSNGPLWYLITLFEIEFIMYFIVKSSNKYIRYSILVLMFFMGYFIKWKSIFRIGQIPVAYVFFNIGYISKDWINKFDSKLQKEKWNYKYVYLLISICMYIITCYINGFSEMAALNYGNNYLLYYVVVLSAFFSILIISILMQKNRIFEFMGKNSLTIMCCHFHITRFIIPKIFEVFNKSNLLDNILVEFMLFITVLILMIPIIIFINNYCHSLCGSSKIMSEFLNKRDKIKNKESLEYN